MKITLTKEDKETALRKQVEHNQVEIDTLKRKYEGLKDEIKLMKEGK